MADPVSDPVIEVEDLHKTYPNGTKAVQGVSFRVARGEVFGILGPNGAGKSTTIGVLGTLVRPTGGRAAVGGFDVTRDPMEVRRRIGFAMQEAGVDHLATGREFLILQARLYGIAKKTATRRAERLLEIFELDDAADKRIGGYSGGMRRRVDLAAALIHAPRILFLDEPTEGLDPRGRQRLWKILDRVQKRAGVTTLLSTHYMEEADRLCDRLAIMEGGRIVAQGTPRALKDAIGGQSITLEYAHGVDAEVLKRAHRVVASDGHANEVNRTATGLVAYVDDAARAAPRILRALDSGRLAPENIQIHGPTLDDVYLRHTGRKIEEAEAEEAREVAA